MRGNGAGHDARQVVRAVADQRRALLSERRDDELAVFAVRQHRAGLRVDDLEVDEIVPVVHAALVRAAHADARAVHLGEAVNVVQLDAELVRDAAAHLVAPALAADDALSQVDFVADAALFDLLGQQQRVGRRGAEHRALHVLHHAQLLIRVAGAHRDDHRAELLRAVLEADARGPQAVSGRHLDTVARRDARHLVAALEELGPVLDVLLRVGDDDRRAGRARGGVDAHDLLLRHRGDAERIRVAQLFLVRERQLLKIRLVADHVDAVEFLLVEAAGQRLEAAHLALDPVELFLFHHHNRQVLSGFKAARPLQRARRRSARRKDRRF